MNDRHILASPNWYYSCISDINIDGIFAYGGKNTIFLLDLTRPESCQYFGQLYAHKDRVTSVNFCKTSAYSRCCVSASEDLSVIIWDVDAKEVVSKHNRHQTKTTAVYWSQASHDCIYSGDEKGHIFSWNHQSNEIYEHVPLVGHIDCISCSPDEEGIVVVGYKTGQLLVLLIQREKQEIVNVLKGHNNEIHSLVWSPVPANELPAEIFGVLKRQESGYILASGSRDKTIRLWDVSAGHFIAVVHVPNRSTNRKTSRDEYLIKSRLWNTLCWTKTDPNFLISSGFNGDILAWDLSKNSKQKWHLFNEGKHSRIVFNICYYAANDVMVSVSMDRLINVWNRRDATVVTSFPTCGGFVYSLDISVLDPSRLAVGVGDSMIRVWDTMTEGLSYGVTNLWREIGTKVMKVLWHPVNEGLLAFGTEEGKVGIYNVLSQTCNVSRTYHERSVYSLSWGPPSGSSDNDDGKTWHLYSCGGEGIILEHKPEHFHDEAKNIDQLIKMTNKIKHHLAAHSEVACKPDRSLMVVGGEDGSIRFYRFPDLKLLSTVNVHNKSITCLVWYRTQESNNFGASFLASGSNGSEVHVHDLKHTTDDIDEDDPKVITSSYRWLTGHSARVTDIVWSPHSSSRLASSSYDGTVEVWDVVKGEPLANYRGHSGRVMTVAWSLMDPNVLFSGSDDFTVRSWRISQQLFREPPAQEAKKFQKSKKKKNKNKKTSNADEKAKLEKPGVPLEEKQFIESEIVFDQKESGKMKEELQQSAKPNSSECTDVLKKNNLTFPIPAMERNQELQKNVSVASEEQAVLGKVESKRKKKKGKSMFPLSATADNKARSTVSQECVDIAKFWTNSTDTPQITIENINLGLFLNRRSAFSMLSEEGIHHAKSGNIDYQLQLEIWKGNIGKALELAVEKKQLTDWLVAVSHLAGEQVRLAVTEAFADQLVSQGSYQRAALYYLSCHKVYEAIQMLRTADMYREAVSLAKVRLLPTDPLMLDLYSSWGRKLESESNYELASKCYLACAMYDDAIRVVTRRGDEFSLYNAAQIAKLTMRIDLSHTLILQCALLATRKAKWNDALEMIHDYPDMLPFLMLMFVHKTILSGALKYGAIKSEDFFEIQETVDVKDLKEPSILPEFVLQFKAQYERRSSDSISYWGSNEIENSYSVCKILDTWWTHCGLHVNETRLPGFYVQISTLGSGQNFSSKEDVKNVFIIISKNICLGLMAALLGKPDICMDHFLKALIHCHDSGYSKLLRHLVKLLFPFGPESWDMIKCLSGLYKESATDMLHQCFSNIMGYYYRAVLTDVLTSQKLKRAWVLEESQQNSFGVDSFVCQLRSTKDPSRRLFSMDDTLDEKKDSERSHPDECSDILNLEPVSNSVDINSCILAGREEEIAVKEIYRIAIVCSTFLLSDIHTKESNRNYIQVGEGLEGKTDVEMSLLKIPFPNAIESACMLVDLLNAVIFSRETQKEDKEMAVEHCQRVIYWAIARCSREEEDLFKTALANMTDP